MERDIHVPEPGELPTARQLNRATAIAAGIAAILLVTVVMPAEYGVDPTGAGKLFGLTEMGVMKTAAAGSADPVAADDESGDLKLDPEPPLVYAFQSDERQIALAPGEGREVKARMKAGGEFDYEWSAGAPVHYELHGEPENAKAGEYTSYDIGISAEKRGKFRAPFAGTQGWYWRNDGSEPVIVKVSAKGIWANFDIVPKK